MTLSFSGKLKFGGLRELSQNKLNLHILSQFFNTPQYSSVKSMRANGNLKHPKKWYNITYYRRNINCVVKRFLSSICWSFTTTVKIFCINLSPCVKRGSTTLHLTKEILKYSMHDIIGYAKMWSILLNIEDQMHKRGSIAPGRFQL